MKVENSHEWTKEHIDNWRKLFYKDIAPYQQCDHCIGLILSHFDQMNKIDSELNKVILSGKFVNMINKIHFLTCERISMRKY